VTIKLVDANDDGKDELYIKAYLGGRERNQLIGLEPLTALVDSYSYGIARVSDYVKEYRLTNVWIAEDDMVHVEMSCDEMVVEKMLRAEKNGSRDILKVNKDYSYALLCCASSGRFLAPANHIKVSIVSISPFRCITLCDFA
jgi:hypothetical protein